MRLYRYLDHLVKPDLSTITLPPKEGAIVEVEKVLTELFKSRQVLLKGFFIKGLRPKTSYDHIANFSPGVIRLSGWLASGAIGKGPVRIFTEIATISQDLSRLETLDNFVSGFRASLNMDLNRNIGIIYPSGLIS